VVYPTQLYGHTVPTPQILAPITGKRKALCIGINYSNNPSIRLDGCLYDVQKMAAVLSTKGFQLLVLGDNAQDPKYMPTRANILHSFEWLVAGAQPGDSLFFQYSGHGTQVAGGIDSSEPSGSDEAILPLDYKTAGMIIDDEIYDRMVKVTPHNCRLTAVIDCCHSGTDFDLPYVFEVPGDQRSVDTAEVAMLPRPDLDEAKGRATRQIKTRDWMMAGGKQAAGDVVLFSACKDEQTAADGMAGFSKGGAMTTAFIEALNANPNQTYIQMLVSMRDILRRQNLHQIPQLSSSKPIHLQQHFSM